VRRLHVFLAVASLALSSPACSDYSSPPAPTTGGNGGSTVAVQFVYRASTTPRSDLPASTQQCVAGVGQTHIHPSWRGFALFTMTAAAADRWEITLNDAPVGVRLAIRVSDGNVCDENPTGAATRNVFANGVLLTEIVPTPGTGTEPGLAFTVAADGRVTP
jgi:hypothetical protein